MNTTGVRPDALACAISCRSSALICGASCVSDMRGTSVSWGSGCTLRAMRSGRQPTGSAAHRRRRGEAAGRETVGAAELARHVALVGEARLRRGGGQRGAARRSRGAPPPGGAWCGSGPGSCRRRRGSGGPASSGRGRRCARARTPRSARSGARRGGRAPRRRRAGRAAPARSRPPAAARSRSASAVSGRRRAELVERLVQVVEQPDRAGGRQPGRQHGVGHERQRRAAEGRLHQGRVDVDDAVAEAVLRPGPPSCSSSGCSTCSWPGRHVRWAPR